jgi:unsaturated rhamnogalacturonyl hydrolase
MGRYFEDFRSIAARGGGDVRSTLRAVACRYIGENPPAAPLFRVEYAEGFRRLPDYRYDFDLGARFPSAPDFSVAYAWGALYAESARKAPFAVSVGGPLKVYLGGELVFKSHIGHERTADQRHPIELPLAEGWNCFVLEFTKTPRGFGGVFGTGNKKSAAFHFLCPSAESVGAAGWLFTAPMGSPLPRIPSFGLSEAETGAAWLPRRSWRDEERELGVCERVFGRRPGLFALSRTRGDFRAARLAEYGFRGESLGPIRVWVGDRLLFSAEAEGSLRFAASVPYGAHDIVVESRCSQAGWGFSLGAEGPDGSVRLELAAAVGGCGEAWLHAGPFAESPRGAPSECLDLRKPVEAVDGPSYFRLDLPGAFIRPFIEGGNFGQWHYPIGVILYGLLVAGRTLESADIETYAQQHLQLVADWYDYMRWDGKSWGASSILHHLYQMDCLDDCGSAGAAMLEAALRVGIEGFRPIADDIARYVEDGQERLPDGAFCRDRADNPFMAGTLWSDDLYMSVPFLCRYWRLSGEESYLDDAVRQARLYRRYLLIEGMDAMSHVYDVSARLPNGVPWGRGNGWVAFSLTELLTALPEGRPEREELLDFFATLCRGLERLQGEDGMWHQVLSDRGSYPETSCTAMFLFALSRGLRMGWIEGRGYEESVRSAWKAICSEAIDQKGNVYGVCRGSGFSFTESYYRDELGWILNDLHGIGVILLAGAEYLSLERDRAAQAG